MENTYYQRENNAMMNPLKIRAIKATARENLLGKYSRIIASTLFIYLVFNLISTFFSPMISYNPGVLQYIIYYAAIFIINLLLNFFYVGVNLMHLKAGRGQEITYSDLAFPVKNGSNRFLTVAAVVTLISCIQEVPRALLIRELLPVILENASIDIMMIFSLSIITIALTVVGIILMLCFSLSFYLLIDNDYMGAKEALVMSNRYMRGNKVRLFLLTLSFIGLLILGLCTACITYLWIIPYMEQASAVFYETLVNPTKEEN